MLVFQEPEFYEETLIISISFIVGKVKEKPRIQNYFNMYSKSFQNCPRSKWGMVLKISQIDFNEHLKD